MNLLFVCLGNICRSPLAAGVMRRIFAEESIEGTIDSAGTADWNAGYPADARAIATARLHSVDLQAHRARQITRDDFSKFDLIFVMDRQNETALKKLAPKNCLDKIKLLAENEEVRDPYSGSLNDFYETYDVIESACLRRVREILKQKRLS